VKEKLLIESGMNAEMIVFLQNKSVAANVGFAAMLADE